MVGILVHGNNHFILSGPARDRAVTSSWHEIGRRPSRGPAVHRRKNQPTLSA